jgi:membrane protease YdiL (CAAX protease family)
LEVRATAAVIPIVVSTVVLAPILEELTFRGLLYRTAVDKGLGRVAVAVITAAAFMVAHVLDSELWTKAGSATLVTLFLFGLILAEIRRRTGSLAAAIFTHSGFNLTTIVALLFFTESATGV